MGILYFIFSLLSMSKGLNVEDPSGMSVSQVTDEVLYAGLVEMQELPELKE